MKTGNGMVETCPVTGVLRLLEKKWVLMILRALSGGALRFCQLQAAVGHVNPATLSARLRDIQREGVVRQVSPEGTGFRSRARYELTPKGKALWDALRGVEDWAREWGSR